MQRIVATFALAGLLALTACATQKTLEATGGSRADGTVDLSYEFGMFEAPKVDMDGGLRTAQQRCAAWGYSGAEPFGGQKNHCEQMGNAGCLLTMVTISYQCTGNPPAR